MSIRHSILALLSDQPMYGYQLRGEFEARTGATWPLNVGQVYTTLDRLERDKSVQPSGLDDQGRTLYEITAAGRTELAQWFGRPVDRVSPPRDELAIKLAMAVTVTGTDVRGIIGTQRSATMRALRDYTRLKAGLSPQPTSTAELSWQLVLEALIFDTDAELRWLDHCEASLVKAAASRPPGAVLPAVQAAMDHREALR